MPLQIQHFTLPIAALIKLLLIPGLLGINAVRRKSKSPGMSLALRYMDIPFRAVGFVPIDRMDRFICPAAREQKQNDN
ncbi:hypothetical protein KNHN1_03800 [Pseudomonas guariconensis]